MKPSSVLSRGSVAPALSAGLFAVLCSGVARPARADVTSWMALGGGYAGQVNRDTTTLDQAAAFTYSIGVGTTPLRPLVVGGLLRGTTMFGLGTDLGVAIRGATGGFARGDWGLALDAGALWRSWGSDTHGTWPLQGVATIGAPFGFQLALGGQIWSVAGGTQAEGFFAALELDLLRLTVTRQGATERWWPNPAPAGGHLPGEEKEPAGSSTSSSGYGCPEGRDAACSSSALIE